MPAYHARQLMAGQPASCPEFFLESVPELGGGLAMGPACLGRAQRMELLCMPGNMERQLMAGQPASCPGLFFRQVC